MTNEPGRKHGPTGTLSGVTQISRRRLAAEAAEVAEAAIAEAAAENVPALARAPGPRTRRPAKRRALDDDPLWYKDAIIYQLHVKAFSDSSGDGLGDFAGLAGKLDYIAGLGVTAIWLLPFYPSPLKDDRHDIVDYTNMHADYGTRRDFRSFVREAHRRGL